MIARLHLVTDDATLAAADFPGRARAVLAAHGAAVALHVRGHGLPARRLYELAAALAPVASAHGSRLVVNDRLDIARAVAAGGAQLGRRSLPIEAARRLLPGSALGYSAHDADEAVAAAERGFDWVLLGAVWPTASHPARPALGTGPLREAARRAPVPVLALGGVTVERVQAALAAGAWGVAVLSGVWQARDAAAATSSYRDALERAAPEEGAG